MERITRKCWFCSADTMVQYSDCWRCPCGATWNELPEPAAPAATQQKVPRGDSVGGKAWKPGKSRASKGSRSPTPK